MAEIQKDFDPNLGIPEELKRFRYQTLPDVEIDEPDPSAELDFQQDTADDDGSLLDQDEAGEELDVPSEFTIISQTIRTGKDGTQVVDVVLDVEEVDGAINYEVRMSPV